MRTISNFETWQICGMRTYSPKSTIINLVKNNINIIMSNSVRFVGDSVADIILPLIILAHTAADVVFCSIMASLATSQTPVEKGISSLCGLKSLLHNSCWWHCASWTLECPMASATAIKALVAVHIKQFTRYSLIRFVLLLLAESLPLSLWSATGFWWRRRRFRWCHAGLWLWWCL